MRAKIALHLNFLFVHLGSFPLSIFKFNFNHKSVNHNHISQNNHVCPLGGFFEKFCCSCPFPLFDYNTFMTFIVKVLPYWSIGFSYWRMTIGDWSGVTEPKVGKSVGNVGISPRCELQLEHTLVITTCTLTFLTRYFFNFWLALDDSYLPGNTAYAASSVGVGKCLFFFWWLIQEMKDRCEKWGCFYYCSLYLKVF